MRKIIVAGNWKMNLNLDEAMNLASELKVKIDHQLDTGEATQGGDLPGLILFPPYVYMSQLLDVFANYKGVAVGAQNVHQNEKGAHTGEVSALMLRSLGADYTLVGHSERRQQFGEDDELLAAKIATAIKNGIKPVYCCGEQLPERESDKHFQVVEDQLKRGLFWLDESQLKEVIIAYEPVWAIGTGRTATPDQAQEIHAYIRKLIKERYSEEASENMSILYGGSCNAKNAAELFSQPDVDGGLIGGASLKSEDFFSIIQSF
jgi:triosephosphate isomerase (TIM)